MLFDFDKAHVNLDGELCIAVKNLPMARQFVHSMRGCTYTCEIKEYREKRSKDANAYAWVLIGKIADALRMEKDEVYREMLKGYGQTGVVKIPNSMAESVLREFKYWERHETLPPEEKAQYYRIWIGSSNYNTQEMSIFIDGIVSECQQMGIETMTPDELAILKEEWP